MTKTFTLVYLAEVFRCCLEELIFPCCCFVMEINSIWYYHQMLWTLALGFQSTSSFLQNVRTVIEFGKCIKPCLCCILSRHVLKFEPGKVLPISLTVGHQLESPKKKNTKTTQKKMQKVGIMCVLVVMHLFFE